MADDMDLPEEVALLWGLREAPRKGPKPTLTAADITRAAVAVADAEGLAAVSMSRVAAELGNSTMALYRHVRSKDELLVLMADVALGDPPDLPAGGDWRSGLTLWSHSIVAVAKRHPWFARLPITGPPVGPKNLAWFESALAALSGTSIDEGEKVGIVMSLLTYVHGQIRLGSELAAGYAENPDAFSRQYAAVLARVVDPRRMPALSRVVAAGVFDIDSLLDDQDVDAEFDFGLVLFLDGVAGYLAAHDPSSTVSAPTP
ncbi:TetR/AcrR family transcriptional regulator [Pseudonocardia alaniniphila]|uniref:TetR/AcrR family transcriptional regulator n=1 Tax=Pseudonocardia alaniniphila TaxID=75291 RepID=A0ABS9TTE9_9PSEU|nr:TetR/AcrR family transcriptional regulator [Pseudonocardia alaniniphila]MCH6171820.1 TetR/AcrR family transcriptional regulator [Pseudonocardia alaniniphila]